MRCVAEMCANWTGSGCICDVLDIEPAEICNDCQVLLTDCPHGSDQ